MYHLPIVLALASPIHIDYTPNRVPAACAPTQEIVDEMKASHATIIAISRLGWGDIEQTLVVWYSSKTNELAVTTTKRGSKFTCIVAAGDQDTDIMGSSEPTQQH